MTLVFFGTSAFAVPILARLAARGERLAVVTQPDRPAGRGHKLTPTPVALFARERGLRVETPERLRDLVPLLRDLAPEACVVASYGRIVPAALLETVPLWLNVHPSLLPLYRGATPLQSALRDGRTETGVTIIAMDAGMDTGDVVLRERTPLGPHETYGEVHDRLALRGAELLDAALDVVAAGRLTRTPQSEIARDEGIAPAEIAATATRPLTKDDLAVDPAGTAAGAVNLVRALAPQPLARAAIGGETVKVLAAHAAAAAPADAAAVACRDGVLVLDRLVPPGRGAIDGPVYARSLRERAARSAAG